MEFEEHHEDNDLSISQEAIQEECDPEDHMMDPEDNNDQEEGEYVDVKYSNSNTHQNIFEEMELQVPQYMINLLIKSGFTSVETIKLINKDVLDEVEMFARNDLPSLIDMNDYSLLEHFYGDWPIEKISKFKILIAHKALLLSRLPKVVQKYQRLQNAKKRWMSNSGEANARKRSLLESTNFEEKCLTACNTWIQQTMPNEDRRVETCRITYHEDGSHRILKAKIQCPFCPMLISLSILDECRIINSNFCRHCIKVHFPKPPEKPKPRNSILYRMKTNDEICHKLGGKQMEIEEHSYFDQPIILARSSKPDPFSDHDDMEEVEDQEHIAIVQEEFHHIYEEDDLEEYVEQDITQVVHSEQQDAEDSDSEVMKVAHNLENRSSPAPAKMIIRRSLNNDISHEDRVMNSCNNWMRQHLNCDKEVTNCIVTRDPANPQRITRVRVVCPLCESEVALSITNFSRALPSNFSRHIKKMHVAPVTKRKVFSSVEVKQESSAPRTIKLLGNPLPFMNQRKLIHQMSGDLIVRKVINK